MTRYVLFIVLVLASTAPAQQEPITSTQITTLIEIGYGEREIIDFLEKNASRLRIGEPDIDALVRRKTPPGIVLYLKKRLGPRLDRLTVSEILRLWKQGATEETLRSRVRAAGRLPEVTVDETLQLSTAGLPDALIAFIRGEAEKPASRPAAPHPVTSDEIVTQTALGAAPGDLIDRIKTSNSRFSLTTADFVQLARDGVDRSVLSEMFARNDPPKPASEPMTESAEQPESRPSASSEAAPAPPAPLKVFRDRGGGFSLLQPGEFESSKEYRGRKALVQLIAPNRGSDTMPDVELSVLMVRSAEGTELSAEQLGPVADRFVADLKRRFDADKIRLLASAPVQTWLSNQPSVRVETKATLPDGRGILGASHLLFANKRVYVVSYSVRMERSQSWLDRLETCIRSFSLDRLDSTGAETPVRIEGTDRDRLEALFGLWRGAVRQYDYRGWRRLHGALEDDAPTRRTFAELARATNEEGRRVELRGVDPEAGVVKYDVFGINGRSNASLSFERRSDAWQLRLSAEGKLTSVSR